MAKELLFTIHRSDLRLEFFRAGGKGGQKQNKTSSACRIVHIPSGAVGESRNHRSQDQNRKTALERLVERREFKSWVRVQAAIASGQSEVVDGDFKFELGVSECVPGEVYCDCHA